MSTLQAQVLKHASSSASNIALDSTGKSTFGGLIDTGSVGQIKFPATQLASSDANTLDDYEEGTVNLSIAFGGGSAGVTYSTQTFIYTKIGRTVVVQGELYLSNKGSSTGGATITGFPFATNGGAVGQSTAIVGYSGAVTYTGTLVLLSGSASTSFGFWQLNNGSQSQLTNTAFNNTSDLVLTFVYQTT